MGGGDFLKVVLYGLVLNLFLEFKGTFRVIGDDYFGNRKEDGGVELVIVFRFGKLLRLFSAEIK